MLGTLHTSQGIAVDALPGREEQGVEALRRLENRGIDVSEDVKIADSLQEVELGLSRAEIDVQGLYIGATDSLDTLVPLRCRSAATAQANQLDIGGGESGWQGRLVRIPQILIGGRFILPTKK